MIIIDKYHEAGFNTLWHVNKKWIAGFFCQGPESKPNDGLITYLPLEGYTEKKRNPHLSPVCETTQKAINEAYRLWRKDRIDKIS